MRLTLPGGKRDGSEIASLWARQRIAELKSQTYADGVFGRKSDVTKAITQIALDHAIMSEYTSFVAVDSEVSNRSRAQTSVRVPVEHADGVTMGLAVPSVSRLTTGVQLKSTLWPWIQRAALPASCFGGAAVAGRGGGLGAGSGGLGGGVGAPPTVLSTLTPGQGYVPRGIDRITYDPTDNSLVFGRQGDQVGSPNGLHPRKPFQSQGNGGRPGNDRLHHTRASGKAESRRFQRRIARRQNRRIRISECRQATSGSSPSVRTSDRLAENAPLIPK